MLELQNISIQLSCQQFECNSFKINSEKNQTELRFNSKQQTKDVVCPYCGKNHIHVNGGNCMVLKDMPIWIGMNQIMEVGYNRYLCLECGKTFSEEICFKCPGTRITVRAAQWIRELLRWHLPISSVHEITGIHWETIRNIHRQYMEEILDGRKKELQDTDYKPSYLAVDEFAIHKGHSYATCVMDLEQGDVLWVGKGRSKDCFEKFFEETDLSYLSDVKAIAMDMNASYNILVEKYLSHVEIVYDRYHMQAQFGKDVLGVVRLKEAREHKSKAQNIEKELAEEKDIVQRRLLRNLARQQRNQYTKLKSSRWTLLTNSENLPPFRKESLNKILDEHSDLALCYAMKEEMCRIFELTDPDEAKKCWIEWFEGAKVSGIAALEKFAQLKEKRLDGLVSHAKHNITTGKLEGFNNKIKVAKRIGYGYRDESYFFTLIRYMSIPVVRGKSHNFP